MKTWFLSRGVATLIVVLGGVTPLAAASSYQLVSARDMGRVPPAGGGGDSCSPVCSPDFRFVLFASTAHNLVRATNGLPIPAPVPDFFNVYLRDRSNATTVLVSVNLTGVSGGNGDSLPAGISADGRYALFESSADDLVPWDTNAVADVFVRDLASGTTRLVSGSRYGPPGAPGNGASRSAVLTPDGRYAAFVSAASNLVAGDSNRIADVFVRDLEAGVTMLVSAGAITTNFTRWDSSSEAPEITPDGRFVAFSSTATNLVPGVRTAGEVYVRDLVAGTTGCASVYARIALASVTGQTNGLSFNHTLSADGRFVAYETCPSPLPAGTASGIVLRYDQQTGWTDVVHTNATAPRTTMEESRSLALTPDGRVLAFVANANGVSDTNTCILVWDADSSTIALASSDASNAVPAYSICDWPSLDSSGRYVAFLSDAAGLVTNSLAGGSHLYLRDLQAGTTRLVDADANGIGAAMSCPSAPRLSADARQIAFECPDGLLVPNDRNGCSDVIVRDIIAETNELISVRDQALAGQTANGPSVFAATPLSADGRYVAFSSEATDLVGADTNGWQDVFVRDLATGSNILVSTSTDGLQANGISTEASLSGDGRGVAFTSSATNLVANDSNRAKDVFVRDLETGVTSLVSRRSNGGGPGNKASYSPVISADRGCVMFLSLATDLAIGTGSSENLFVRDLSADTNFALTAGGVVAAAMTPSGRFVAFVGRAFGIPGSSSLYVWDFQTRARVYTNTTVGITNIGLSPDGNRLAYATANQLWGVDRSAGVPWLISTLPSGSRPSPRFSADGLWLSYGKIVGSNNQVFLYDLSARTEHLASHASDSATPAQGRSDSADTSPDGRFLTYRSQASNLVADDTNGFADIFLYDRLTDANTLLSARWTGNGAADRHSFAPVFSADGQTLLFQTWASDMVPNDANRSGDVLSYVLLTAMILPPPASGEGPLISWPWVPGNNYRVQFKASLSDPEWQELPGTIWTSGVKAHLQDSAPAGTRRFYRVLAY